MDKKAEKIAAAKRKLREYQATQQNPGNNAVNQDPVPVHPIQQISGSIPTPINPYNQGSSAVQQHFNNQTPATQPIQNQQNISSFFMDTNKPETRNLIDLNSEYNKKGNYQPENLIQFNNQMNLQRDNNPQLPVQFTNNQITIARDEYISKSDYESLQTDYKTQTELIGILVQEKTNLLEANQKSESLNAELENRLRASRHRVKELETHLSSRVETEKTVINQNEDVTRKMIETYEEQKKEMQEKLAQKITEMEILQKNFDHLNTELHLASVKIQQLSDTTTTVEPTQESHAKIELLIQDNMIKQQQIEELSKTIEQINKDREVSESQYQNYVTFLSKEMESLKENSNMLTDREQNLVKHISELERQIQQQISKQHSIAKNNENFVEAEEYQKMVDKFTSQVKSAQDENEELKSKLSTLEEANTNLEHQLLEKSETMKSMELEVENVKTNSPDMGKLIADMESDKIAASRAMSQNQTLKEQLEEIQKAFVQVSNDKMELTENLQSEMHKCKEMSVRYDEMEEELKKWKYKEEEMIRLSHVNTDLEKKILQQNIEIDRLRHYESKGLVTGESAIEKELENAKHLIEVLTNKINILDSKDKEHSHSHSHDHGNHSHDHEHHNHDHNHESDEKCLKNEIEILKQEKAELLKIINSFKMGKKDEKTTGVTQSAENESGTPENEENKENKVEKQELQVERSTPAPSIATEEALEKLQARFRRTMLEVADLTEEKHRLEHLVTQLQFETETIGEYITLYQFQRRLLKQKDYERDIQLKNLAADREKMNEKLTQLNNLIENYILQHNNNNKTLLDSEKLVIEHDNIMNGDKTDEHQEVEGEVQEIPKEATIENHDKQQQLDVLKKETAGKILEILSDIKTANAKNYDSHNICVEHCSCCLGKLETV